MAEFVRARNESQKAQRMGEVKAVARKQFGEKPYEQISLTTIAQELGWSRANLYKYVSSKEEIFLAVIADERAEYDAALLEALSGGRAMACSDVAKAWAEVADAHRGYFAYGALLYPVVQANCSEEKLAEFKASYASNLELLEKQISKALYMHDNVVEELLDAVWNQGVGLCGQGATDFKAKMRDHIRMCLEWYQRR